MRRLLTLIASAALLAHFAGCDLLTGPGERVIGVIGSETVEEVEASVSGSRAMARSVVQDHDRDGPIPADGFDECMTEAPDTVEAGAPFEVVVRTSGAGSCTQPDGAETTTSDMMIEVVPYDRKVGPNCADAVFFLARTLELAFPEPGDALLRITGRILIVGDSVVDERMGSFDHPIVVR